MSQPWRPMNSRRNRRPRRQRSSAACNTATWFLWTSWLATQSTRGRLLGVRCEALATADFATGVTGSGTAETDGPVSAWLDTALAYPANSDAAARLMPATRRACFTTVRYFV